MARFHFSKKLIAVAVNILPTRLPGPFSYQSNKRSMEDGPSCRAAYVLERLASRLLLNHVHDVIDGNDA